MRLFRSFRSDTAICRHAKVKAEIAARIAQMSDEQFTQLLDALPLNQREDAQRTRVRVLAERVH